jgi:hypothetical protein
MRNMQQASQRYHVLILGEQLALICHSKQRKIQNQGELGI